MKLSSFFLEFWAIPGLIFPLSAAILILSLRLSGWHGSEQFAASIVQHNNIVVVLVQLLSQALGLILVLALCGVIKIHFRTTIVKKPISLEGARFFNALSQTKMLLSERHVFTVVTVLVALLSTLPGAVWAGVISPRIDTTVVDRHVQIPLFPSGFVSGSVNHPGAVLSYKGTFADDPNLISSLLLNSAQRASDRGLHAKLDSTGYAFSGRNFGAGSVVGLESIPGTSRALSYSFKETGISADTHCQRNASSTFGISWNATSWDTAGWPGTTGYTEGEYPNGDPVNGTWLFGAVFMDLFALDRVYEPGSRHADVVIASAGDYNQTQCKVTFAFHTIQVNVNTTARTITTEKLAEVAWPAYADSLVTQATLAIKALTVTDNGHGGSRVQRALQFNTAFLYYKTHGEFPNPTSNIDDALLFQSVSDFITNVVENMVVAMGAYQKERYNSTQRAHAMVSVPSVVFGHAEFEYIIFPLTMLIVLLCIYYVVVRRAWDHVVELDFTDVADVALNASKGGTRLFDCSGDGSRLSALSIALEDPSARWPSIVCVSDLDEEKPSSSISLKSPPDATSASEGLLTAQARL